MKKHVATRRVSMLQQEFTLRSYNGGAMLHINRTLRTLSTNPHQEIIPYIKMYMKKAFKMELEEQINYKEKFNR